MTLQYPTATGVRTVKLYRVMQRPKKQNLATINCIVEAPNAAAAIRQVVKRDEGNPEGFMPDGGPYNDYCKPTASPLTLNENWFS